MPSNHEWFPRYPKDELSGPQRILSNEALGYLDRLRDYSWVNGGIPADETYVRALSKTFGLSAYKFRKLWQEIAKFFNERDGCFFYPEDEERRQKQVELIAKRKWAGKLGATARWGDKVRSIENGRQVPMANDGYPDPQEHTNRREPPSSPQPPATVNPVAEGGGIPPLVNSNTYEQETLPLQPVMEVTPPAQEVCSQRDIDQIRQRAVSLGLAAPSKKLCRRIAEKFLPTPIEGVIGLLVRWDEQTSVGLWNAKSAEDFRLEAARQAAGTPRKPSQRDIADLRFMQRARERDRSRGMA